jgi:predicted  nucleic acid-binding Zn-ribbon protein
VLYYQEKFLMKSHTTLSLLATVLLSIAPQIYADTYSDNKTTVEEIKQEATETTNVIKDYTVEKRDEAARKVETRLNSLDTRIKALEARIDRNWEKMDNAARERARNTLTVLHEKRIRAAEWYGSMKNSSTEAWGHVKNGFSDAYNSLRSSWEKAEKEY